MKTILKWLGFETKNDLLRNKALFEIVAQSNRLIKRQLECR